MLTKNMAHFDHKNQGGKNPEQGIGKGYQAVYQEEPAEAAHIDFRMVDNALYERNILHGGFYVFFAVLVFGSRYLLCHTHFSFGLDSGIGWCLPVALYYKVLYIYMSTHYRVFPQININTSATNPKVPLRYDLEDGYHPEAGFSVGRNRS